MYQLTKKIMILITVFFTINIQSSHANNTTHHQNDNQSIEHAVLVHINEYRQKHGLAPLKMDERISKEARHHSLDMANHKMPFGHNYFLKRISVLHTQIKNSGAGAENVAYNYKDGQDVVKNWLTSPGHKRNIDGNYNLTGIGVARDAQGKIYFTQIFLKTGVQKTYATKKSPSIFFDVPIFFRRA